jgi:hypothetical protein
MNEANVAKGRADANPMIEIEPVTAGKITICLTDHAPVRIVAADWPVLTQAFMNLYRLNPAFDLSGCSLRDAIQHDYMEMRGEYYSGNSDYLLPTGVIGVMVRRHQDGRALLYGLNLHVSHLPKEGTALAACSYTGLGGRLLQPEADLREAVSTGAAAFVNMLGGGFAEAPLRLAEACLSRMPSEDLDDDRTAKPDSEVIVLSGGHPVGVSPRDWPIISDSTRLLYMDIDEHQAEEIGHERLAVRQHRDGRCLVYGFTRYEAFEGCQAPEWLASLNIYNLRGGRLLPSDSDPIDAIRDVGIALRLDDHTIRACINGLPAQDLV